MITLSVEIEQEEDARWIAEAGAISCQQTFRGTIGQEWVHGKVKAKLH